MEGENKNAQYECQARKVEGWGILMLTLFSCRKILKRLISPGSQFLETLI